MELFAAAGLPIFLHPVFTVRRDVKEGNGFYFLFEVEQECKKMFRIYRNCYLGLRFEGEIAYYDSKMSEYEYDVKGAHWGYCEGSLGFPLSLGQKLEITPFVAASTLLSKEVRRYNSPDSIAWYGVQLEYEW